MSDVTVEIAAKDVNLEATLKGIQDDLKQVGVQTQKAVANSNASFASMAKAGAAMGIGIAATLGTLKAAFAALEGTLGGFAKAINLAADWQQMEVAFNTLIGDTKLAKGFLQDLKDFAATTPFSITGLGDASKTLLAFGQSSSEVIPTLKMLGDVSMGNEEKLQSLARAFGKVQSQGKLTGEELNMMIDAGFNPLREISDMTGKSVAELRKDMEKGAISADMVAEAFKRATSEGGQFFGMTQAQGQTFNGVMSTMKDTIDEAFRRVGTPIIDALTPIIQRWTENLNKIMPIFDLIGDAIGGAITWFDQWINKTFKVNEAVGNIEQALKGIATGQTGAALENIFLSMQMWAKDTANEIWKNMQAVWVGIGELIRDIFDPEKPIMRYVVNAFDTLGIKFTKSLSEGLASALKGVPFAEEISKNLEASARGMDAKLKMLSENSEFYSTKIGSQLGAAFKNIPDSIAKGYDDAKPIFDDIDSLQQRIDENNKKIAESAAEYVANSSEGLEIEKAKAAESLKVAQANLERAEAADAELATKREQVLKELELTEAKKSGNKEVLQGLQWQEAYEKKLNDILPLYGKNEDAAKEIARRHADAVAPLQTINDLLNEMSGKKIDPFDEAGSFSERAKILRGELKSIETQLGITLGSGKDWRGLADIFGIDTFGKDANKVLGEVRGKVQELKGMPADVIVKLKEEGVKKFFEDHEKLKNEPPIDIKIDVESEAVAKARKEVEKAQEEVDRLNGKEAVIEAEAKFDDLNNAIKEIEGKPVKVEVEADPQELQNQLAQTKLELRNNFVGGDASGGNGGEGGEGGEGGAAFAEGEETGTESPLDKIATAVQTIVKNWPVAILA